MSLPRSIRCVRRIPLSASHQCAASAPAAPQLAARRPMSASAAARAGGHESHYDPPSGWLFGVRPGEKYEKEGWERIWFWGMYGSLGLATVAYVYKPDTSIQTWALEEARRRLEAEGILEEGGPKKGD